MDWKVFFVTFGAVFFAELADKTQLVGIGMASESKKPLAVWFGSVFAYMIITALSVLIGLGLSRYLKPEFIRYAGASLYFRGQKTAPFRGCPTITILGIRPTI